MDLKNGENDYGHLFDLERRGLTQSTSLGDIRASLRPSSPNIDDEKSAWESITACPMTTRPYFELPHKGMRRTRSRSLGSALEGPPDPAFLEKMKRHYTIACEAPLAPLLGHPEAEEPMSPVTSPRRGSTKKDEQNSIVTSLVYGAINATIVLPVLMSFGSIIYRDQAFSPYSNVLVKLTLVSGIVHQLSFSAFSSLPFAVGQVQDAGLIFLSSMATSIVKYCRERDLDDETILATTTVGLGLFTGLLGIALVGICRLKLAQYVQLLPTSVVGGYLAYIGWFCGISGVGLMANNPEVTLSVFLHKIIYVLPGIIGGLLIYTSATAIKHMAVLPTCILMLLTLFYLVLWWTETSIEEATEAGWIRKMNEPPAWYETWQYLKPSKVYWAALPRLALTEAGMIFVVALSSSLDVAAIELELGRPLDYNHELGTVGVSNIISGFTGGYTGSYIFSQSIFSLRAGIRSRLSGFSLALCQIVVFMLPFPILSFVPNFFFGSLLSMICFDLMYEWLYDVRTKLTRVEYIICLGTFVLIQLTNVEYGIGLGVIIYIACRKLGLDVGDARIATAESEEEDERVEFLETKIDKSYYGST